MAICWSTRKQSDGSYRYIVQAVAYQSLTRVLKAGRAPTRAVATRHAKQWALFYRRMRDQAEAA